MGREEEKRNKRFYRLSSDGQRILNQLLEEWQTLNSSLTRIVDGQVLVGPQEAEA
jgi:PadR family transcriptional regulator PadR